jgi:ornithine cyclodeaminase/alanine dehydrogenase-like protein (mu-crystallin family)
VLFISDSLVAELLSPAAARDAVVETLCAHADGRTSLSDPRGLFLRSCDHGSYYHVKGGSLEEVAIAGFRIGGFPRRGQPRDRTQLIVLSDLDSATPIAILGADSLTAIRVGAAVSVTVEWLRPTGAETLAVIGAGKLARAALRAIQATTPFRAVRVASRSAEGARELCDALAGQGVSGLKAAASPREASLGADVVVTLTSADEPIVEADWCRPGGLLVTAGGGKECEDRAILSADKIFVDDWAQCAILGDLAALRRQGKISEADIAGTLANVVAGRSVGRTGDERIVAVPQGLTILDIALGHWVYRKAAALGIGARLADAERTDIAIDVG